MLQHARTRHDSANHQHRPPDQRLACKEANMISPVWDTGKAGAATAPGGGW
jgi:hypothetical protein